jgi:hypothetical protein
MFHGYVVDGRPSCIPREGNYPNEADDANEEGEDGGILNSPMSSGTCKRPNNISDIASSPLKSKSPMFNTMRGL